MTRVAADSDSFGGDSDEAESIMNSNHYKIYRQWLGEQARFAMDTALPTDRQLPDGAANPILDTAHAQTIKSLITNAESFIFVDIFLIGGSWGLDIA